MSFVIIGQNFVILKYIDSGFSFENILISYIKIIQYIKWKMV